jgi:putative FmdB family regulatory protein
MPTYEYACKTCGERLEIQQKFTDDALTECPACGGDLRKVFGNVGISFKGSGFYKTDSRKTSSSTSSSSDSKTESSSTSSTDPSPATPPSAPASGDSSSSTSSSTAAAAAS